jgi:hypothetical protein
MRMLRSDPLLAAGIRQSVAKRFLREYDHGGIDYRYPLALAWLAERPAG